MRRRLEGFLPPSRWLKSSAARRRPFIAGLSSVTFPVLRSAKGGNPFFDLIRMRSVPGYSNGRRRPGRVIMTMLESLPVPGKEECNKWASTRKATSTG